MTPPPLPAAAIAAACDAVRAYLRIAHDNEEALTERHVRAALAQGEAFTARSWFLREWQEALPVRWGWQRLRATPVRAITAVETGSAALPLTGYALDIDRQGDGWVQVRMALKQVQVRYTAGMAQDWSDLPPALAQGAVLLAAHFMGGATAAPPDAVTALWSPWRRLRLNRKHKP